MQSEAKVNVTENVYRHNPYTHYIGKTHLISQRLSLTMPRLNHNQRIQALMMLARGDNVSNVSRAFDCHRNTIIRLHQRFQQTGGVADRRRPGRPRVTNPRTDRFITLTHLRRRFQKATSSTSSTVSANRQCCAASGKPGNPLGQGGPMWDKCLQHVIGLPVCSGQNDISVGGDSSGLGFYSLMSLSHHDGRIRVFRRREERFSDNCLMERK